MLMHAIRADADVAGRGVASKLNPDWAFIMDLKNAGRRRAAEWLDENFVSLGKQSTVDIAAEYL
jgi:NTE family protein